MKLNEVLDVFGNESLDTVMTPEQEYEASLESLIEEIDNVMDIRAGLESMEEGAVELAKASCESLLTGLAVREMSIANEDADLAYICNAFNVKPELFGLEADEATMKEKIKAKAGKAGAAIKNSRVAKAAAAIYAKIVAFLKSFFSLDNIIIRTVRKLVEKAKGLFKKGAKDVEVQDSATEEVLNAHEESMETVKKGLLSRSYDKLVETINALIAKIKAIDFKKPFVKSGEFLKKVLRIKPKQAEKVSEADIKEAVKDLDPAEGNKILKAFQTLMASIKGAFKRAVSFDLKSLLKIGKGKEAKAEGVTESVEFGIESLDALFGEISRVNAGLEEVEVPEEYAEIGVEGMEMFEELDAHTEVMEAIESVEEMYIEATIPSQIAALESIAIEKGLNPDNGVSFDLFGTMSAGIEAADEVVEKASEETKKTMKDRVKGAGAKLAQMAKSALSFVKAKFSTGISALKNTLKAIKAGMSDKSPEEIKAFFKENSEACNKIFLYVNVLRASLNPLGMLIGMFKKSKINDMTEEKVAKLREEIKEALKLDPKTAHAEEINKQYIDSAIALLTKAEKYSRGIKGSANFWSNINALQGDYITFTVKSTLGILKASAKDLGKLLTNALKGAKNLLVKAKDKVKSKFSKKAEEAPVEA